MTILFMVLINSSDSETVVSRATDSVTVVPGTAVDDEGIKVGIGLVGRGGGTGLVGRCGGRCGGRWGPDKLSLLLEESSLTEESLLSLIKESSSILNRSRYF